MIKPNLGKSIKNDYTILFTLLGGGVTALFTIYAIFVYESLLIIIFSVVAVLFLFAALLRYIRIKFYFKKGILIQATINNTWFYRDRGRISYTYQIDGKDFTSGTAVMMNNETRVYVLGDTINILVHPTKHKHAMMKDIYEK